MAKLPADEERCTRGSMREDGRVWRCFRPRRRVPGYGSRYCEKHYLIQKNQSKRRRKTKEPFAAATATADELNPEIQISRPPVRPSDGAADRSRVLAVGQIWAYPHPSDGFPRSYARIDRVFPNRSLVKVTPLVPAPVADDEKRWAHKGLPFSCGIFRPSAGPHLVKEISIFSHQVRSRLDGISYRIFPRRGEVWAVYERVDTAERKCTFQLVEVLSGFDEVEKLVTVVGLAKVEGVYRRCWYKGFNLWRQFEKKELLLMFSHGVPALKVEEGSSTKGGLWKVKFH